MQPQEGQNAHRPEEHSAHGQRHRQRQSPSAALPFGGWRPPCCACWLLMHSYQSTFAAAARDGSPRHRRSASITACGHMSHVSRPSLGYPSLGYPSAISRLSLGCPSAMPSLGGGERHLPRALARPHGRLGTHATPPCRLLGELGEAPRGDDPLRENGKDTPSWPLDNLHLLLIGSGPLKG